MSIKANPYLPMPATIQKITIENDEKDLKSFRIELSTSCEINLDTEFLKTPGTLECHMGIEAQHVGAFALGQQSLVVGERTVRPAANRHAATEIDDILL